MKKQRTHDTRRTRQGRREGSGWTTQGRIMDFRLSCVVRREPWVVSKTKKAIPCDTAFWFI